MQRISGFLTSLIERLVRLFGPQQANNLMFFPTITIVDAEPESNPAHTLNEHIPNIWSER